MKKFLTLVSLVAILVGLIVIIVHLLRLSPEVAAYAVIIGVGIVAIAATIGIISRFPLPKLRLPRRRHKDPHQEALRAEATKLRTVLQQKLRGTITPNRFGLRREAQKKHVWVLIRETGGGKSALIDSAPGAQELICSRGDIRVVDTDDTTFVEFASSLFQEEELGHFVRAVLRTLTRWRRSQPISGIALVSSDPGSRAEDTSYRQVLHRLSQELQVQVPTILIVSHLDKMEGFSQVLKGVSNRDAPLGFFVPEHTPPSKVRVQCMERLLSHDAPASWVEDRALAYLIGNPTQPEQLAPYRFATAFKTLAENTAEWAAAMTSDPPEGCEAPRLRGVFFTGSPGESDGSENVFAGSLLATIFPREGQYATRTRLFTRRAKHRVVGALFLSGLISIGFFVATISSARNNRALLTQTQIAFAPFAGGSGDTPADAAADAGSANAARSQTAAWRTGETPSGLGLGLFYPELVRPEVSSAYQRIVCAQVLRPIARRSSTYLAQLLSSRFVADSTSEAIDHLRLYLLLSYPESPGQPTPDPWLDSDEFKWLSSKVLAQWPSCPNDSLNKPATCGEVLPLYRDIILSSDLDTRTIAEETSDVCLASGYHQAIPRDHKLVMDVRRLLQEKGSEDLDYEDFVKAIKERTELPRVSIQDVRGWESFSQKRDLTVDPTYTKDGWTFLREALAIRLEQDVQAPAWLLNKTSVQSDQREHCKSLRARYVADYKSAWTDFISDAYLVRPGSLMEAQNQLSNLAAEGSTEHPIAEFFRTVATNTTDLPPLSCERRHTRAPRDTEPSVVEQIAKLVGPSREEYIGKFAALAWDAREQHSGRDASTDSVHRDFSPLLAFAVGTAEAPSKLVEYHTSIQELRNLVIDANNDSSRMPDLKVDADASLTAVQRLVRDGNLGNWRNPMAAILLPPVDGIPPLIGEIDDEETTKEWCDSVFVSINRMLALYPFSPSSPSSTNLKTVAALLDPETGELAEFRKKHFASKLNFDGDRFRLRALPRGQKNTLTPQVVDFINSAYQLGETLFPSGSRGHHFELELACTRNVNFVQLTIAEDTYDYKCGPTNSWPASWPGEGEPGGRIILRGARIPETKISAPGDFGLLELMELHGAPRRAGNALSLSFGLTVEGHGTVPVRVIPANPHEQSLFFGEGKSPVFLGLFRDPSLTPPRSIFSDVATRCGGRGEP